VNQLITPNLISYKEEAMKNKCVGIVAVIFMISFVFAGCGHDTLKENWGSAYNSVKQNQTANPDASKNLEPVVGLDGTAAEEAMKGYQQGCDGEKSDTTYNLRLGTIEGIGEQK
jgi:hypothetical protein